MVDELEHFGVDAETAHQVAMHEVQVAVGVASSLQDLQSGATERARPRHVDQLTLVPDQHLVVVGVHHLTDVTTSYSEIHIR